MNEPIVTLSLPGSPCRECASPQANLIIRERLTNGWPHPGIPSPTLDFRCDVTGKHLCKTRCYQYFYMPKALKMSMCKYFMVLDGKQRQEDERLVSSTGHFWLRESRPSLNCQDVISATAYEQTAGAVFDSPQKGEISLSRSIIGGSFSIIKSISSSVL